MGPARAPVAGSGLSWPACNATVSILLPDMMRSPFFECKIDPFFLQQKTRLTFTGQRVVTSMDAAKRSSHEQTSPSGVITYAHHHVNQIILPSHCPISFFPRMLRRPALSFPASGLCKVSLPPSQEMRAAAPRRRHDLLLFPFSWWRFYPEKLSCQEEFCIFFNNQ